MFIIILLVFFIIFYNIREYLTVWRFTEVLPGPPSIPILGHISSLREKVEDQLPKLFYWGRTYGTFYRLWIGNKCYICVADPKDVEFVLNKVPKKAQVYHCIKPLLGEGLLTSQDEKWMKHRKLITRSFHFKILQDYFQVMEKTSNKLIQKFNNYAKNDKLIDFLEIIQRLTFDILCETAMGVEINSLDDPNTEIIEAFRFWSKIMGERQFGRFIKYDWCFRLTENYPKHEKACLTLKEFGKKMIQKRREFLKTQQVTSENTESDIDVSSMQTKRKVFLDTLIAGSIDGKPLTMDEMLDEINTFLFAGHDTLTSALSFLVYNLSLYPEFQDKIYEEQKEIFCNNFERDTTYQDIQQMKYLEYVIRESMRLYTPIPIIGRIVENGFYLRGKYIPPGVDIMIILSHMGRNEEIFNDYSTFNPDRFIEISKQTDRSPYELIPFSAGARNCLGQKYAMNEIKLIMSKIIKNFEIIPPAAIDVKSRNGKILRSLPKPYKLIPTYGITMKPTNGIKIRLKSRQK